MRPSISLAPALLLLLFLLQPWQVNAQDDSLWTAWEDMHAPDSVRLRAMQLLAWKTVFERPDSGMVLANAQLELAVKAGDLGAKYEAYTTLAVGSNLRSDPASALAYFQQCLVTAREMADPRREANTLSNMSNVFRGLGDLPMALEKLQRSLAIDESLENTQGLAGTYNNIGNIYTELGDLPKALDHYTRSVELYAGLDDIRGRAQALSNLAVTHGESGEPLKAIEQLWESRALYTTMGRKLELGMVHNNLGRFLGRMGRTREAMENLEQAEVLFNEVGHQRSLARTHFYRGEIYLGQGNAAAAMESCQKGRDIAEANDLLTQHKECSACLMDAFARLGRYRDAYLAQQAYMNARDSLSALNNSQEVMRMELARAFQEQQIADSLANARAAFMQELAHQEQLGKEQRRRNLFLFSGIGVLAMAGGLYNRLRFVRRSRAQVQHERERSENLLLNILPVEVAQELKDRGRAEARHYEQVTVLFSDFKGFTSMAEQLSPEELVNEIDHCFRGFDDIMARYGIEKIKTIGDAYMAAAGLPDPDRAGAVDMVRAALEMQDFIRARRTERLSTHRPAFEMRIGLHTGPLVAGIVGSRKFAYDIWGDTVNIAARMESSGDIGEVNISAATYDLVAHDPSLVFTPRGKVEAKGKGLMKMFFVGRA